MLINSRNNDVIAAVGFGLEVGCRKLKLTNENICNHKPDCSFITTSILCQTANCWILVPILVLKLNLKYVLICMNNKPNVKRHELLN
jgi:hypothetical protein